MDVRGGEEAWDQLISITKLNDAQIRIRELEAELDRLKDENRQLKECLGIRSAWSSPQQSLCCDNVQKLTRDQIERYSRQLLLQEGFGVKGQCELLNSSVLVVGAGGIGSTALLYLAASGVGHLDVMDGDQVEMSNLHRQIIHAASRVGWNKAVSACRTMLELNPTVRCQAFSDILTHSNADIIQNYDCIIDASDNPKTRYLINDACVLYQKPLVSGSAVGTEAQFTVYNYKGGPCYRCLYPVADASASSASCSDAGVLGPVPGLIGILQAMEAIKLLTDIGTIMAEKLLMYDSLSSTFVKVKKPPKQATCPVCGINPSIQSLRDSEDDLWNARGPSCGVEYPPIESKQVTSEVDPIQLISVSCHDYNQVRKSGTSHVLIDVRVEKQYEMCSLSGSMNIPLAKLGEELEYVEKLSRGSQAIYCICRRGVASKQATELLETARKQGLNIHSVRNIAGGLVAWQREIDPQFPKY